MYIVIRGELFGIYRCTLVMHRCVFERGAACRSVYVRLEKRLCILVAGDAREFSIAYLGDVIPNIKCQVTFYKSS